MALSCGSQLFLTRKPVLRNQSSKLGVYYSRSCTKARDCLDDVHVTMAEGGCFSVLTITGRKHPK